MNLFIRFIQIQIGETLFKLSNISLCDNPKQNLCKLATLYADQQRYNTLY